MDKHYDNHKIINIIGIPFYRNVVIFIIVVVLLVTMIFFVMIGNFLSGLKSTILK